jgi:signal transduction histidine kinase
VALLLVLAPAALFSYLVSRPTTLRLEALAEATSALRAGDYGIRVPVVGEDEVARLQANFNAMAADLERAVREVQAERDTVARLLLARRELVASVSHELRTPVATLRSYLESTLTHWNGAPPPTLQRDLEVMERETIHLQALINDLFTLARAEVGRLDLRREPTDVVELARRVVETMAPLAWQSGRVELIAEASERASPALADASRLEQVLQNLLHNGVRHTPPGGIVVVAVNRGVVADTDSVVLQVKDTGEGIAPADLPHIWERFYRADSSRAHAATGTGLGLALVKEMTEAMGGTVAAESTLGQGSCFTVRLPRAPISESMGSEAPPGPREPALAQAPGRDA